MNRDRLNNYLLDWYSEPLLSRPFAEKIRSWINNPDSDAGKMFIQILQDAEDGKFR